MLQKLLSAAVVIGALRVNSQKVCIYGSMSRALFACTDIYQLIFREYHEFLLLCLKVLCTHLSLALSNSLGSNLVGKQAKPLRNLLFKLIDTETPDSIQQVRK